MSKKFFYVLTFLIGTCSDPAQGSYCSELEDECQKECKEENARLIVEVESRCVGLDVEEEAIQEALSKIDNLSMQLSECQDSCRDARRECNKKHPESVLEDHCERLENEVSTLKEQIQHLEGWHRYWEHERRQKMEKKGK